MRVVYHPAVQGDASRILRHYDSIDNRLGDEFWEELNSFINRAAADPQRFHFEARDRRRVNLRSFPYHFLFREIADAIRITVIRHHKQRPEYGLKRRQPARSRPTAPESLANQGETSPSDEAGRATLPQSLFPVETARREPHPAKLREEPRLILV